MVAGVPWQVGTGSSAATGATPKTRPPSMVRPTAAVRDVMPHPFFAELDAEESTAGSALALPVVHRARAAGEQMVTHVPGPDAELVAVRVDRDRRLELRRDHQHARSLPASVGQLVRAAGADREADDVAAREHLLALRATEDHRPVDHE